MALELSAGIIAAAFGLVYYRRRRSSAPQESPPEGVHFGVPLAECPTNPATKIPFVLETLSRAVRPRVGEEGIFRVTPEKVRQQALLKIIEASDIVNGKLELPSDALDPASAGGAHLAASLIKVWLRTLPEQDRILAGFDLGIARRNTSDESITDAVSKLSETKRAILLLILDIALVVVADENNRMNTEAFAVCIAPALFETPDLADANVLDAMRSQRNAVTRLIQWYGKTRGIRDD